MSLRPAATVVLVRPSEAGFEVLLLKRHARSGFMANAYVFPGGRVDEADGSDGLVERLNGVDISELFGRMAQLDSETAAGAHLVACIRETFEDAGLLLASRGGDGALPESQTLEGWRDQLNGGQTDFETLVQREGLALDAAALHYFAHWITPTAEPKRYDTRFFLSVAPGAQEGGHDGHETTDTRWTRPQDALDAHEAQEMMLAPPTWIILGQLAAVQDVAGAVQWAKDQRVETIQPTIAMDEGCLVIALPGDPLHEDGGGADGDHRRVVLRDGRWMAS